MLKKWAPIKLALVFLAISSCGWQLRDSSLLGINLGAVSISYPESQNTIGIELKRELQANNVQIVGAADKASYKLKIIDTTQSQRVSARNENARAAQYQIYLAVDYIVVDALGAEVIPMTTASAESSYNFDENDILASHNEEVVLQDNLRTKIVRQIIFRLGELSESIAGQL